MVSFLGLRPIVVLRSAFFCMIYIWITARAKERRVYVKQYQNRQTLTMFAAGLKIKNLKKAYTIRENIFFSIQIKKKSIKYVLPISR